jgi:hypothetical protein
MTAKILEFRKPSNPVDANPSKVRNMLWNWSFKAKSLLGGFLNKIGFPALLREVEIEDQVLGEIVRIRIGRSCSVLSIDNRDFYFDRLTGKFTGTGCSKCH